MQKIKKFKSEIAQFSQNKANFPPFFLLTFSSGGIPPPQIPPFLRRNTKYSPKGHLKSYLHSWGPIIYILPKFLPSAMFPY